MIPLQLIMVGIIAIEHLIVIFIAVSYMSYNIPVTILRFMGNKERPTIIHARARKKINHGVPRLKVRGYKTEIRDFLSENYYPTVKGKYGGLILWEFEDGMLTPTIPVKVERQLTEEQHKAVSEAFRKVQALQAVKFKYDPWLHNQLKQKAVDDVDVEFLLQEVERVDSQYASGWRDFLSKYAAQITIGIVAILLLVGWVVWLDKAPNMMAQCASAAKDVVKESLIQQAAAAAAPGG